MRRALVCSRPFAARIVTRYPRGDSGLEPKRPRKRTTVPPVLALVGIVPTFTQRLPCLRWKVSFTVAALFRRQLMAAPSSRVPLRAPRWLTAKRLGLILSLVRASLAGVFCLAWVLGLAAGPFTPPAPPGPPGPELPGPDRTSRPAAPTALGAENAWLTEEIQLPASTAARTVWPTSASVSSYLSVVAPAIALHPSP